MKASEASEKFKDEALNAISENGTIQFLSIDKKGVYSITAKSGSINISFEEIKEKSIFDYLS